MMPAPIGSRRALRQAITQAETVSRALLAGQAFGSKAERVMIGTLLWQLAGLARRAFDPASRDWAEAWPPEDAA